MSRKEASDGGKATVDKLYPEANDLAKIRLVNKLKTYSSDDYRDRAFPKERNLVLFVRAGDRPDKIAEVHYLPESHIYVRNLLELDNLVGSNKRTIQILWPKEPDARKQQRAFLKDRFGELRDRGQQYLKHANNAEQLMESLLGNRDPVKEDLFILRANGKIKAPERLSFVGLTPLERIDRIERDESRTDAEKDSEKAVAYLEMDSTDHALEFANKALTEDPTNGYAWMVKGYLSLKGVREAQLSCVIQQELGARANPITVEEQWRQQLLEEDAQQGESKLKESVEFFLKAWVWWPKKASGLFFESYTYKQRLMSAFFKNAVYTSFDKELLRQALRSGRRDLESLCLMDVKLFLTAVLPVAHSVDEETATDLAKSFVRCVKKAKPVIGDLIPPDSWENRLVLAVGKNLEHLHKLSLVLPFEEVESFMHEASRRFIDLEKVFQLKDWSNFYLGSTVGLRASKAAECSLSALRNIPFDWSHEYGCRLKRQWQYFHLRWVVQSAIESMLYKDSGKPEKVATLVAEALSPELLEQVAGKDHFIEVEVEDEDDISGFTDLKDLGGRVFHVLHNDVVAVLSEFIHPLIADTWFEELIAEWESTCHCMCRSELLLLYLDGLASGTVKAGYQDFLRSLGRNGRDINEEFNAKGVPEFKALKGHTATSFLLAYALKAEGVKQDVTQKLEGMRAVCEKIATTSSKEERKIIK